MESNKTEIETELKIINNKTTVANQLSIPLAIVFAGILIAGAIIYTSKNGQLAQGGIQVDQVAELEKKLEQMREVDESDRIRGDINASVKIVEYSDTECPFCKQFHATLKRIMDEYSASGKVAWVYRHFPLEQLHPKARSEAVALECANEIGGREKFWLYTDRLYEITPANNGLDPAELPKIASFVGLNVTQFNSCLTSGKHDVKIDSDLNNALASGGTGTPWSIVVAENGKKFPINGALPYEAVKQVIEQALKED